MGPKRVASPSVSGGGLNTLRLTQSCLRSALRGATIPLFAAGFGLTHALTLYWLRPPLEGQAFHAAELHQLSASLLTLAAPTCCVSTFTRDQALGRVTLTLTTALSPSQLTLSYALTSTLMCLMCLLSALSALLPLSLLTSLAWGPLLSAYLGLSLMSLLLVSVSLWASATASSAMGAWLRAWVACLLTTSLGALSAYGPSRLRWPLSQLGADLHLEAMLRGVIELGDVLYFALGGALAIFFASQSLSTLHSPPSVTYTL